VITLVPFFEVCRRVTNELQLKEWLLFKNVFAEVGYIGSIDGLANTVFLMDQFVQCIRMGVVITANLVHRITFLDLTNSILNTHHSFKIFRKPISAEITILNSSFHYPVNKNAAFMSMIHRLLTIHLLPQNFHNEVDTIKYLAQINDFIVNLCNFIQNKPISLPLNSTTTHPRPTTSHTWICTPFIAKLSFKLSTILKHSYLLLNQYQQDFIIPS